MPADRPTRRTGWLVALLASILALAAVTWNDAGARRYAVLEDEAQALLASAVGFARAALDAVARSEEGAARRLETAARRLDRALAEGGAPDARVQAAAEEERIARIYLVDPRGSVAAVGRWPVPPPPADPGASALPSGTADALERERVAQEARGLPLAPGDLVVEGLAPNPFGTRTRLGVALGREDDGLLLLRADADALAAARAEFGIESVLGRLARVPGVAAAWVAASDGRPLLGTPASGEDAVLASAPIEAPGAEGARLALALSTARADEAVSRSRRAIAFGALAAAALAGAAFVLLSRAERRHRAREADLEARRAEDRRLADLGALAGAVAHEVRNPLNAFRIAAALLRGPAGPESAATVAATLEGEVRRLDDTIEAFLALARTAGPRRRPVRPGEVARAAADRVAEAARAAGVQVDLREADLAAVAIDPDLVEQILTALLRNAILATDPGGAVRLLVASDPPSGIALTVEDRGPGIAPEMRPRLFTLGGTGRPGGHGLGLALALRFAEAHGGTIDHEEVEPHGARFVVRLPAEGSA
jgi:signal transduction histidine kinase